MVDVKVARERAALVAKVHDLTEEGKAMIVRGITHDSDAQGLEIYRQGCNKLVEAGQVRDEFWAKYPNALIHPNHPWMSRNVDCS